MVMGLRNQNYLLWGEVKLSNDDGIYGGGSRCIGASYVLGALRLILTMRVGAADCSCVKLGNDDAWRVMSIVCCLCVQLVVLESICRAAMYKFFVDFP